MSMKRIWVAGPRAWENPDPIEKLLATLEANYGIAQMLLVTGGATGVDHLVEEIGTNRGIHVIRVRACWPVGRKAGPIRNQLIAKELEPDALIVLHYLPFNVTNHRGTQNAIKQARRYKIPYKVVRIKPEVALPSSVSDDSPMGNRARSEQGLPPKAPKTKRRRKAAARR